MSFNSTQSRLIVAIILIALCNTPAYAKKMYRWEDDQGNVFISDQIRPELKLSSAGEKIIAKQKSYDRVLVSTFRSIDDLLLMIKGKSESMESRIKATDSNLNRLQFQLDGQQKKAAAFERNAQKVPNELLKDITSTQQQIQETQISINSLIKRQTQMKKADNADIERYLFLTQLRSENQPKTNLIASRKDANELGLFYCENDHQCNKAWEIGRNFVRFLSTTGEYIDSDKFIMSRQPSKDNDLSLSLSKIAVNESEYQLFLRIRCRDSSLGKELCKSERVNEIRSAFRPYINDALSRMTD